MVGSRSALLLACRPAAVLVVAATLLLASQAPATESAPQIPTEHFLVPPRINRPKLSADGNRLAYVANHDDRLSLVIVDLGTRQSQPIAHFDETSLVNYWWKGKDHIVLLIEARDGWREFLSYDYTTAKITHLAKISWGGGILDPQRDDPKHMLAGTGDAAGIDLRRLDVLTGKLTLISRNPGYAMDWFYSPTANRPMALCLEKQTWILKYRANGTDGPWLRRPLGPEYRPDIWPVAIGPDGRRLIALDYESKGPASVVYYDPISGAKELLCGSQGVDPTSIDTWTDDLHRPRAALFDSDRTYYKAFDAQDAALLQKIDASLPDTLNQIVSQSDDGRVNLIRSASSDDPGTYYILDLAKGAMETLGRINPLLAPGRSGSSRHFEFTRENGFPLSGRIWLPEGNTKPPLVLMASGDFDGPRTNSDFDRLVQLLVHHGYAVIKVNHRGVTGLGRAFHDAGSKEITGEIPNDVLAGAHHAIAQGWVDGNRVAIFGINRAGVIALNALARSDLPAVWINFFTPMVSRWFDLNDIAFGDTRRSEASMTLGGFRPARRYRDSLDPRPLLKNVRVPSFHLYPQSAEDSSGGHIEKHFKNTPNPYRFVRMPWRNLEQLSQAQATRQARSDQAAILDTMLVFLGQHLKNKPAKRK